MGDRRTLLGDQMEKHQMLWKNIQRLWHDSFRFLGIQFSRLWLCLV